MIKGRCECQRVRYEANAKIEDFSHCHCSQCRRLHGAGFASFGGIPRNSFRFVSGEQDLRTYASSKQIDRIFCGNCGSNMLCDYKLEPESLYLIMSTVEGDPALPPGYHQFVGSKAPWITIGDGLPQHHEWPNEDH